MKSAQPEEIRIAAASLVAGRGQLTQLAVVYAQIDYPATDAGARMAQAAYAEFERMIMDGAILVVMQMQGRDGAWVAVRATENAKMDGVVMMGGER